MAQRLARSSTEMPSGCVEWNGARVSAGYGHFELRAVHYYAHRAAYELRNGAIPAGHEINHKCRNKACINPDHLEALTPQQHVIADHDLRVDGVRASAPKRRGAMRIDNTSGYPCVVWQRGAWVCQFGHSGKRHYVGRFANPDEAVVAAEAKRAALDAGIGR
jgi:hypothetical protein